jgi:hypothetical protein
MNLEASASYSRYLRLCHAGAAVQLIAGVLILMQFILECIFQQLPREIQKNFPTCDHGHFRTVKIVRSLDVSSSHSLERARLANGFVEREAYDISH